MSANKQVQPSKIIQPSKPSHLAIFSGQVPHSVEAEEAVIGSVLVNPEAFYSVANFLKPDDFYILRHATIWDVMLRISERGDPIDYLTVQDELRTVGRLQEIGGPAFLTQLLNSMPSSMHAEVYGRIVERTAVRRRLLAAADEIKGLALDEDMALEQVTDESEERLFRVTSRNVLSRDAALDDQIKAYWANLPTAARAQERRVVPTVINSIDNLLGGFAPQEVSVIAGIPGSGKTSLLTSLMHNMVRMGISVIFFSCEMSHGQIINRFVSHETAIPSGLLKKGPLDEEQIANVQEALRRIRRYPLTIIDEYPSPTPLQLKRRLRIISREVPIDIVFVDGLYLMRTHRKDDERAKERKDEMHLILNDMVGYIAHPLDIPVVMSHQFNREAHKRKDRRPRLSDFKDSSAVDEIAHLALGIYRESAFTLKPGDIDGAELIVMKNRDGDYGTMPLGFFKGMGKYFGTDSIYYQQWRESVEEQEDD